MVPFYTNRFGTININTKYLEELPEGLSFNDFLSSVLETMTAKLDGINIRIVQNSPVDLPNMKELYLINDNDQFAGVLGLASPETGSALVNITDVWDSFMRLDGANLDAFSEAVGTVATHEIGHLYLPSGHSAFESSLMGEGPGITEMLADGGSALSFTDLQIQMVNCGVGYSQDPKLYTEWQNASLPDLEINYDFGGNDANVLDQSIWGDFNPDLMDSIEGLGDLSVYGEMASSFDLGGLDSITADGITEMISGCIDVESLGQLVPDVAGSAEILIEGLA
jgi:hypothetical protein